MKQRLLTIVAGPASLRLLSPLCAMALSVVTGALVFALLGVSPTEGLYWFFISPVMDAYGWSELVLKVCPILLCAVGLSFCFKAGVWNIGAEGQFVVGALAGGWCALALDQVQSHWALVPVVFCGVVGGLLWAGITALLKVRFHTNEILTSIMLNYVAINLLMYAVNGPLKDPQGFSFPESALFTEFVTLPLVFNDYRINVSVFVALWASVGLSLFMRLSPWGFAIRAQGANAAAARNGGNHISATVVMVLLISGALAGLAGVFEVTGPVGQLIPQLSLGYGYTAIICVYLGRMNALGILLASLVLGLTFLGGEAVQLELELPKATTAMFQGMLLFYLLASDFIIHRLGQHWQSSRRSRFVANVKRGAPA